MTRSLSILIALLAAPALTACYVHPGPVDGGPRDGGPPADSPPLDDSAVEDAQADAHEVPPDARIECTTDDDCDAVACQIVACVEGACVPTPSGDGLACDDGDLCTESDVCTAGACAGTERPCSACRGAGGTGATLTTLRAVWDKSPEGILAGADGSVTVTGFADSELWLAAVGADGAVIFDQGHGDESMGDRGYALARPVTGAAGRTLVAGYSQVDGGHARPWLIEVDGEGGEIAAHTPFGARGGSAHGLVPLPDGATIVLAHVDGRATLARLSAELEIEWERSYFDVGWAYGLAGVAVMPDGDLVIAGDVGTFPSRSIHVVRVRPTGDVVWDQAITADAVRSILALPDGTIIVVGQRAGPAGTGAAWLARLDAGGNIVSQHAYGADPNGAIESVARAPDGTLVLAAVDAGDAWILRTDADGAVREQAVLSLGAYERADVVHVLGDGTVIVAGTSDLPGLEGPRHAWVARAATLGALDCTE